ncbi:murein biosynthesis integral membrane protein MurJ [Nitratidesulfovibrio vulgaris]|nr:murein biosynthesis integral membrane protein MurJ [Nitratidesulfovibrio vulgaris]ABM28899.1 integral membrane protein MviN [Nitratidesulfovibrio vulgaris DP4]ADP86244.1 integral membrane protein MviN [Nitratidesulfovibrio vulgaris RCH1]GEB78927.1 lipid II flippase MurJ [Desulfovibrio desulfuricans]
MRLFTRVQHMGAAALLLAVSIFLSRFMGLVRDKVISWHFGASAEADIYFAAFVIPDFLNYLLAGGYFSITLIPLLAAAFERDADDGWRFFSAAFWWVAMAIGSLTAVAWWFAPQLAHLAAPGFSEVESARLARFLRIVLPAQACFLPGACLTALLYHRRQFTVPALTPLVYNGSIIAGGLLMLDRGMEGFCWGVLGGAALGSLLLPLLAVRSGGLSLRPVLRHPQLRRFVLLALPLMLGQSIVVLDEQFVRVFGSMAGEGAVSLLNYARRIMLVPVGVVAQAAGVASYPFLAALAAKGDGAAFDETMRTALRNTLVVILPLALWMAAAAEPTLRLIFQGGDFATTETLAATPLLQIMLCGVAFWAVQQVVGRGFYARQDTVTPAVVGTVATLTTLPLYVIGAKSLGATGVALAGTCGVVVYTVLLTLVWRRRHGGGGLEGSLGAALRSLAVCVPAMAGAWFCATSLPAWARAIVPLPPAIEALGALGVSGGVFGVVYLALACRFAPDVAAPVVGRVRGVLKRLTGRG